MQDLRDQALKGEVILWNVQIKDYDQLKDFLKYCGQPSNFKFSALPVDANNLRQMVRLAESMGIEKNHVFENHDDSMETIEKTNEDVCKAIKAIDDDVRHCTLVIYCYGYTV